MTFLRKSIFCFMILAFICCSTIAYGQEEGEYKPKPLPSGKDAYTEKDYKNDLIKFYKRTLVEAYEKNGNRNPSWDKLALSLLNIFVGHLAETDEDRNWHRIGFDHSRLLMMKCDDPLVLYCLAAVRALEGQHDDCIKLLEQSVELFKKSKYPKVRAAYAAEYLTFKYMTLYPYEKEKIKKYRELTFKWLVESLKDDSYKKGEERFLVRKRLGYEWHIVYKDHGKELCELLKKEIGEDKYITNAVCGTYHIKEAWKARGNTWASDVPEEGWKGFGEHLAEAKKCLKKAWKENPRCPVVARHMIMVVMAGHGDEDDSLRLWFDRAVSAQFDYMPAYQQYLWANRPRWGGSLKEMYNFGLECYNTKRFDTAVPIKFFDAMVAIEDDLRGTRGAWDDEGNFERLQDLFDKILQNTAEKNKNWYKTLYAAILFKYGKYDLAKAELEKLGDNVQDLATCKCFDFPPSFMKYYMSLPDKKLFVKPTKADLATADEYYKAGTEAKTFEEKIKLYTKSIEIYPNKESYNNRGNAYKKNGDYDKALSDFKDATNMDLEKKVDVSFFNLSEVYLMKNQIDKALTNCQTGIQINPKSSWGYCLMAEIYLKKGNAKQAIIFAKKADELYAKPDIRIYFFCAEACRRTKMFDEAIEYASKIIKHWPDDPAGYYKRSQIYFDKKDYEHASRDADMSEKNGDPGMVKYLKQGKHYIEPSKK